MKWETWSTLSCHKLLELGLWYMAGAKKTFAEGQSGTRPFTHSANMHRYPLRWTLAPLYWLSYIMRFQGTSDTLNNTHWHVRLQASESYLPASKSSVPGQSLTAKNARGFTSNTMTPNSSGRYPETPKTGHWLSAQRAHNSSLRPSNTIETKHTATEPPNRPRSSRQKQMRITQILQITETHFRTTPDIY